MVSTRIAGHGNLRASVICSGNDIRSRSNVLKKCGGIVNSLFEGYITTPLLRPVLNMSEGALRAVVRVDNMVPFLKYESEIPS